MFNPLCVLIIAILCCHHVSSRHLVVQPFYSPYSDYSYTYSGPGPLYHQQHHSPFFAPPGTYFDQRQGILRPFPGGGVPVLVDYHKRCSNQFVGLKAHPDQHQYYYVCKPDCVIFGKCQNLQMFNATCGQCVQHPPPEYKPSCSVIGRFPLFSDCHLYYKCEEDLKPKIYTCPASMIFSPTAQKCINGRKCTPTQISPHSSYIPEICANNFPPCFENGIFRSPADCSLYYKCDLKSNGIFMQTRLRCQPGNFYDLKKKECRPAKEVPCDCIQVAELVYPKPNTLHFQPALYPAQYELDTLEEGLYPVEHMNRELNNNNCNATDDSGKDEDIQQQVTTTLAPTTLDTTLNHEVIEQNDIETAVLSDYIDISDNENDKNISTELEELTTTYISSEEQEVSTESFSSLADSEETSADHLTNEVISTEDQFESQNEIENEVANLTEEKQHVEETSTTNDDSTAITDQPGITTEENENISTEKPATSVATELNTTDLPEVETTVEPKKFEQEEETTTTRVSTRSIKSQPCENIIEFDGATDTHTQETLQTQKIKCLQKLTTFSSNTDVAPSLSRNTLHEKKLKIPKITTIPATSHLTKINITQAAHNLVIGQPIKVEKNLLTNLLDAEVNSEVSGDILSQEKVKPDSQHPSNSLDGNFITKTISKGTAEDTRELTPIHLSASESDVSLEDDLSVQKKKISNLLQQKSDLQRIVVEATEPKFNTEKNNLQQIVEDDKIVPPANTMQEWDSSANNSLEPNADHEPTLLANKKKNDFKAAKQMEKNLNESSLLDKEEFSLRDSATKTPPQNNITTNVESTTLGEIDFSDEELIPVHSESMPLNQLTAEEESFDDDYTTVKSEKELTSTAASVTTVKGITQQEVQTPKIFNNTAKETTVRRRQVTLHETTQPSLSKAPADAANSDTTMTAEREDNSLENASDILDFNVIKHGQSEEVSSTSSITSNSKQQPFPHTPSSHTLTRSPIPKTSPEITTSEPSEKQTSNLILHVRQEQEHEHEQTSPDSPTNQCLHYILKPIPVISNNANNSHNETFTAPPSIKSSTNASIPRLEIIAERPIDVHFSICPIACDKNHARRKDSTLGKRAVLLKWFANKSNQTLAFETANELRGD